MDKEKAHTIVSVLFHLKKIQVVCDYQKYSAFKELPKIHLALERLTEAILASENESEAILHTQHLSTKVTHLLQELNQLQKLAGSLQNIQNLLKPYDPNTGNYEQNNS